MSGAPDDHSLPPETERVAVRLAREALDADPSQWPELLSGWCGENTDLRLRVEALLAAIAAHPEPATEAPEPVVARQVPAQLGPFQLIECIGRGGMGEVWRGERIEGGFQQRVAIKLVRGSHIGLTDRFQREQQILARLNHPNIAHLIDGGLADTGDPWLALEYVEGERITEWCDRQRLSIRARVRLLLTACRAVQFAHQNLIIHRDIKPANLLVNTEGSPKLLDFGIAKLLDAEDPGQTQTLIMTPAYAAPEQLRGEPVTTATDVYQLGLVLFEMLTGCAPERASASSGLAADGQVHASCSQALRLLQARDPEKASEIAGRRGQSPSALIAALRGDLEWIIAKAMAWSPVDRHGSVHELALDLRNWLAFRPLLARRPGLAYRIGKFVNRNRAASALGVAAFAFLIVGVTGMWWQSERALREAERANAVQAYLTDIFSAAAPGAPTDVLPGTRELLERGRAGVMVNFEDRSDTRAELLTVLSRIHRQMGLYAEARPMAEEAVAIRATLFGPGHPDHLESLFELGEVLRLSEALTEAGPMFEQALALAGGSAAEPMLAARIQQSLGVVQSLIGEHVDGERNLRQAGAVFEQQLGADHEQVFHNRYALALALDRSEQFEASEVVYRQALAQARALFGNEHVHVANVLGNYAALLRPLGRYAEAEVLLIEALAIDEKVHDAPHPSHALHLRNLSSAQSSLGKTSEAEQAMRQSMQVYLALYGDDSLDMAKSRVNLGSLLIDLGRADEAVVEYRRSLDFFEASVEDYRLERGFLLTGLSRAHRALGDWDQARQYSQRAIDLRTDLYGPDHPRTAHSIAGLARLELVSGDAVASERLFRQALVIVQGRFGDDHPELADRHLNLGEALQALQRHDEAIAGFRESLRICERSGLEPGHPQVVESRLYLAESLLATGRIDAAREQTAQIVDFIDAAYQPDDPVHERWRGLQAGLSR